MKNNKIITLLIIIIVVALVYLAFKPKSATAPIGDNSKEEIVLPQIEGNKEDLVSFSIKPGQEVSGVMKATGVLSGGYFFEGNLPVAILDANKNLTTYGPGHGQATTDWMTSGPVSFEVNFDFSKMPKGNAYIKLTQDDPSGGESGRPIRSVLIPILIK